MLLSSGYNLIIKSVKIIFRPYYFVKLFCSSNSQKNILKTRIVFFVVVFSCCVFVTTATILGVQLVGHNDSSLVTPVQTSCYMVEKRCRYFGGKKLAYL